MSVFIFCNLLINFFFFCKKERNEWNKKNKYIESHQDEQNVVETKKNWNASEQKRNEKQGNNYFVIKHMNF